MKQWREIIIGRPRALCFICSVLFISNHVAPQHPHVTFYLQVLESHAVPPSLRRPLHRSADDDTAFCRGLQRARAGLLGADGHSAWNHPVFFVKKCGFPVDLWCSSFSSTGRSWETYGNLGFQPSMQPCSMEPAPFRSW